MGKLRTLARAIVAPAALELEAAALEVRIAQHAHSVSHLTGERMCNGIRVPATHTVLDYPRAMGYVIPESEM